MVTAPRGYLYAVAFGSGAVVMATELGAGRLVAPWFGTSTPVWALLIGSVLASLAAGQLLGGRLARRRGSARLLAWLLVASGAMTALMPMAGRRLLASASAQVLDGRLAPLAGAAVAIALVLALPVAALGATGPLLLHQAVERAQETGPVSGRIYALGTAGGLLGTWLSGLVLVPLAGTAWTLWSCAAVLLLLGGLGLSRRAGLGMALLAAGGLAAGPPAGPRRPSVLWSAESALHAIRIESRHGERRLYLDEGFAAQSVYPLDGGLPLEGVWGWYGAAPAFTSTGAPGRALLVGLGGGTSARILATLYPGVDLTGVEPDPEIVEAGRMWMGLPATVHVVTDGGRAFVNRDRHSYDLVIVDAFRFPYLPFQLCTVEFFEAVDRLLAPGGALMLNTGRRGSHHEVVDAVARTLARVFPHVRGFDVGGGYNTILVATRHPPARDAGVDSLGLDWRTAARLRHLGRLQGWSTPPGTPVLTDDRAPVETLTDLVLLRAVIGGFGG